MELGTSEQGSVQFPQNSGGILMAQSTLLLQLLNPPFIKEKKIRRAIFYKLYYHILLHELGTKRMEPCLKYFPGKAYTG